MPRSTSEKRRLCSNSIWFAATSPFSFKTLAYSWFMPSSIERSAPAQNASLLEVMTTPFTAASPVVCFRISSSSVVEVSSSTFIERPGMSQVTSAMPSASVSSLKFLKAMLVAPSVPQPMSGAAVKLEVVGWAKARLRRAHHFLRRIPWWARFALPTLRHLHPFDDRRRPHAAADAQRHQRGGLVGALQLVEHGTEDHRPRRTERMAECDRAAIDVDLRRIDVEGLNVAQHHRGKGLVQFEQVDVRLLHAGALEQLFGYVDRTGQHHRGLRADIGKGADFCTRLQAMPGTGLLAAEQHRARAVDDP